MACKKNKIKGVLMRKIIALKQWRRRKAILAKKLRIVCKDLNKLSNHIKDM